MKPEDLVCYCGVYGGTCARWEGYKGFREAALLLGEWCDAQLAKAREGFELHLGRYVSIRVAEKPQERTSR